MHLQAMSCTSRSSSIRPRSGSRLEVLASWVERGVGRGHVVDNGRSKKHPDETKYMPVFKSKGVDSAPVVVTAARDELEEQRVGDSRHGEEKWSRDCNFRERDDISRVC